MRYRRFTHPGAAGMNLRVQRLPAPDMAFLLAYGFRLWLAWMLRGLADRIDRTQSWTWSGTLPQHCTQADFAEAVDYGSASAGRYLADISNERSIGADA